MEEQAGSAGNSPQHGRGSARQDVLRCGWLRKQGGFVKTWHTRWFVLRGDQLHYYKDEDETKALGSISLPGNRVTEHPSNGEESGKFLFEVIPGKEKPFFYHTCDLVEGKNEGGKCHVVSISDIITVPRASRATAAEMRGNANGITGVFGLRVEIRPVLRIPSREP
ncbi:rho GTPase-activating protein 24-like [Pimephales promelas]|uniref:rho GTPase-activating protein 24-like n=1 Tax=Pimephales promelas TaxID=90988 RepID=UPI00195559E0|nr:rho GTPase-activating protein 24-like [Pimephales promelas]